MSKKPTLETEARWLADNLVKIETGKQISVAAEIDGKLAGNCLVRQIREQYTGALRQAWNRGLQGIPEHRAGLRDNEDCPRRMSQSWRDLDLILEVFANNERAIHLYEKVGFREAGRTPKKINRNGQFEDDILMVIQLR